VDSVLIGLNPSLDRLVLGGGSKSTSVGAHPVAPFVGGPKRVSTGGSNPFPEIWPADDEGDSSPHVRLLYDAPEHEGDEAPKKRSLPLKQADCPGLDFLTGLTNLEVLSLNQVSHPCNMQHAIICLAKLTGLTKLRLTDDHDLWGDIDYTHHNRQKSGRDWKHLMPLTAQVRLAEFHIGGTWHLNSQPKSSFKKSCNKVMRPCLPDHVAKFQTALSNSKRGTYCSVKYVYGDKVSGTFELKGEVDNILSVGDHINFKLF
jgi:hypothetical protein